MKTFQLDQLKRMIIDNQIQPTKTRKSLIIQKGAKGQTFTGGSFAK